MNIIYLIDSATRVNQGVWHAALQTSHLHASNNAVRSYVAFVQSDDSEALCADYEVNPIPLRDASPQAAANVLLAQPFSSADTIIVSHGCWRWPTRCANKMKRAGFSWLYTPHNMLSTWCMQQKPIKKWAYFHLIERRLLRRADQLRALNPVEQQQLLRHHHNTVLIPNGVTSINSDMSKPSTCLNFVFMARLHSVKNIAALVQAWVDSSLNNKAAYKLTIAGPDDGELARIEPLLARSINARYSGAAYDDEKQALLEQAHFFLLPSESEGCATSLLEAMSAGAIPAVSTGCNMPVLISDDLGFEMPTHVKGMRECLDNLAQVADSERTKRSRISRQFVEDGFTVEHVALAELKAYQQLLNNPCTVPNGRVAQAPS